MLSGSPQFTWSQIQEGQADFDTLVDKVGCRNNQDQIACLRKLNQKTLLDAAQFMAYTYGPVIDGEYITRHPFESYSSGTFSKIPIYLNTNKDEATVFLRYSYLLFTLTFSCVVGSSNILKLNHM